MAVPPPIAIAVERGDDRAREGFDSLQGAAAVVAKGLAFLLARQLGRLAQVCARAKGALTRAGEDDDADLPVRLHRVEGRVRPECARRWDSSADH